METVSKNKAVIAGSLIDGLRRRLFLLVLVAVVPILGLIAYNAHEEGGQGIAEVREKADRLVEIASARQIRFIDSARQLLAVLAETPDVRNGDATSCSRLMRALRERYSFYANLGVVTVDGNVWCSGIEFSGTVNVSHRAYFRRATISKDFAIGNYQIGAITRKGSLNFGYPVLDQAGSVNAVLFAALDLAWMTQLASETRLPEYATLSILDNQGTILARFPEPEKWVGQPVPDASLFHMIQHRGQRATELTGPDGVARLYAFNRLGGTTEAGQIYIAIGIPKEAAFSDANRTLVRNLIWLGIACLLALAGAWFIGNRYVVGFISERAKAENERRGVLERIRALHEIGKAITSTLDLQSVLKVLMEKIDAFLPSTAILVWLIDQASGTVERTACWNLDEADWKGRKLSGTPSLVRAAIESRAPVVAPNVQTDPRTLDPEFYRRNGLVSYFGVPLIVRGEILGVLVFLTRKEHHFTDEEIEFFTSLAAQAAIAIHNSQLHEQTRKQAMDLERANEDLKRKEEIQVLLKELNQDVTQLEIDTLLKKLTEKVREILRVDISDVRVLVEGQWKLTGIAGINPDLITSGRSGTSRGPAGWIQQHRQSLVIPDLTRTDLPTGTTIKSLGLRGYVGVPLFSRGGEVIGVLRVLSYQPRDFTQEEVDVLEQLATGTAVALENARLLEEIKRQAVELEKANEDLKRKEQIQALLKELNQDITGLEIDPLLKKLTGKAREILKVDVCDMRLRHQGKWQVMGISGIEPEHVQSETGTLRGRSGWILEHRKPLVIPDMSKREDVQTGSNLNRLGITGYLGVPLISKGGEVIGVLRALSYQPKDFTQEEIDLLQLLANGSAIALENASLLEEIKRQAVELEKANEDLKRKGEIQALLKELNQDIMQLDIDTLLTKLTEKVREILRVDISDVRVLVKGEWKLTGIAGIDPKLLTSGRSGVGQRRTAWIREHRQPLVIPDITRTDLPTGTTIKSLGLRGYVGVPLFSTGGEVIGVLRALSYQPRDFTQEEVDLLQQLANGTGIALANARLLEEIKRQAVELEKSNKAKDELLDVMARQKEELSRLNAGLEREIAERGRARAEIAAKNRDLETLLYVTSHDLREPLRAIENFSRMVNDRYNDRLDDKGKDFLRRVIQGSQRLNRLLDDILILSRSQRMGAPTEEIDGETIVVEALKRLEAKISATNAQVKVAKDFHGLRVDKTWATQAVYNLIANALKFTRNGEPPDVEIAPYQPQGPGFRVIGIAVRDRGPGVAPEHAERIFQLFQRAVGREVEGTGAGLAIVRQIAERHGGSAWVEPREGGGSEFIITFSQGNDLEGGNNK